MSSLTEARTALAALLTTATGWKVHDHLPARITAPTGTVTPGSPYLDPGDTFGTVTVRLVASLVSRSGANEAITESLDAVLEDAVVALVNAGYGFESISQPYALEVAGAPLLTVDITTTTIITL